MIKIQNNERQALKALVDTMEWKVFRNIAEQFMVSLTAVDSVDLNGDIAAQVRGNLAAKVTLAKLFNTIDVVTVDNAGKESVLGSGE